MSKEPLHLTIIPLKEFYINFQIENEKMLIDIDILIDWLKREYWKVDNCTNVPLFDIFLKKIFILELETNMKIKLASKIFYLLLDNNFIISYNHIAPCELLGRICHIFLLDYVYEKFQKLNSIIKPQFEINENFLSLLLKTIMNDQKSNFLKNSILEEYKIFKKNIVVDYQKDSIVWICVLTEILFQFITERSFKLIVETFEVKNEDIPISAINIIIIFNKEEKMISFDIDNIKQKISKSLKSNKLVGPFVLVKTNSKIDDIL